MLETGSPVGSTRRALLAIAIALSVIAAAASGIAVGLWLGEAGQDHGATSTGPEAVITVLETSGSGLRAPVVGANVTLFSVVPDALERTALGWNLSSSDPWSNPFYVELGSGTTGADGTAQIALAPTFGAIVEEWRAVAPPPTQNVSIEVDASYLVPTGTNVSYFHDFAELSFSPLSVPDPLNLTMVGNLTQPSWTGPNTASPPGASSTGCTSSISVDFSPESISVEPGVLPLSAVFDASMQFGTDPMSVSDEWGTFADAELGLGAVQAQIPGPVEASAGPSWSGAYSNFGLEQFTAIAGPQGGTNNTTAIGMSYLSGVVFVVVDALEVVHGPSTGPCAAPSLRFQYVTSWVALATTLIPACDSLECVEIPLAEELLLGPTDVFGGLEDRELANDSSLAPGASLPSSSLLPNWTGYSQAMELTGAALGTSLVYTSDLGEAILLSDLIGVCGDTCSENVSAAVLAEAGAQFGPAFGSIPSFASVDSVVATDVVYGPFVQVQEYTNDAMGPGNPVALLEYVGEAPTDVDLGGSTVSFHAPEAGPWACPVSAPPGSAC